MLKVPSSDKPGQVVFAMDWLLYSGNGCGDRAGKRGVDGSGHTRRLGFSWLTKALLHLLVTKRLSSLTLTRMKEATGHRHWSTVRSSFDAWKSCLLTCCHMPWPLFLVLSVVRLFGMGNTMDMNRLAGFVVMKFSPISPTKPGAAHFGQTALPHLRRLCNIT